MRGSLKAAGLFLWAAFAVAYPACALQVTLPLEEYEALRSRANPGDPPQPPPPGPFALEAADLDITVGATSARIAQALTLTLYASGWQKIPIGEAGSFIGAQFGNLEGRVETAESGWTVLARGTGRHEVRLESVTPVTLDETATRPTRRFEVRLPPAAMVRGRLRVPANVEEVQVSGPSTARREADGSWTFAASPNGAMLRFLLFGKQIVPERTRLPLRFEATSATAATISRTRLRVQGWVEARVAQGQLRELRIPVPEGLEVVSVQGPVAGWDVKDGRLVVTPLEPVESSLAVQVEMTGEPRVSFPSPLLLPDGSARTTVFALAALEGDGLLRLADAGAVRRVEEGEEGRLPEGVRRTEGNLLAVLDPARPPRWEAEWAEGTQVLASQVDRLYVDVAVGESGRAAYQLWAEVRNRGAQQLVVTLPAGFELVEGLREGRPVRAGATGPALAFPLRTGEEAQVISLSGILPLAFPERGGELSIPLPALSAPAARVEVRVLLPGGRSYELAEPSRASRLGAPPDSSAMGLRAGQEAMAQMVQQVGSGSGSLQPARAQGLFPLSPGLIPIEAAWSALSATPAPLVIRVRERRAKEAWF
jgi:hypothetical protein